MRIFTDRYSPLLNISLVLLAATGLFLLVQNTKQASRNDIRPENIQGLGVTGLKPHNRPRGATETERGPHGNRFRNSPTRLTLPVPDNRNAIPDEWQLMFRDSESMRQFMREVTGIQGIDIIATNEVLHILRIRSTSRTALQDLIESSTLPPLRTAVNYRFNAPPSPPATRNSTETQSAVSAAYTTVGTEYLREMGIENHDLLWGEGVTVALVDSGISGTVLMDPSRITSLDLVADSDSPDDYSPHGSIMASLIASKSEVTAGVAPEVSLLDIRVLDASAKGDGFTIAQGIVSAVDMGAEIINLSLGGMGDDMAVQAAIDYAAENGVTVVAAAGNMGDDQLAYPARYPGVIAVGAADASSQHPEFSNTGDAITISAPGYGIITEISPGLYVKTDGTSAAAALVSGAIAGIMSEESLSAAAATGFVIAYADDAGKPGHDPEFGMGLVDLQRISQRSQEYTDLATAGYFWEHAGTDQTAPPENQSLSVTVRNQGTVAAWYITVEVSINSTQETFYIDSLEPGESRAIPTWLTTEALASLGTATLSVYVWSSDMDQNPDNNMSTYYLYAR